MRIFFVILWINVKVGYNDRLVVYRYINIVVGKYNILDASRLHPLPDAWDYAEEGIAFGVYLVYSVGVTVLVLFVMLMAGAALVYRRNVLNSKKIPLPYTVIYIFLRLSW